VHGCELVFIVLLVTSFSLWVIFFIIVC